MNVFSLKVSIDADMMNGEEGIENVASHFLFETRNTPKLTQARSVCPIISNP